MATQKTRKYEILAPAGNADALVCAVQNGADAVYFGLDKFNARMKADNFTPANLREWVKYCHFFGVKTYVTLNVSLKQEEFADAVEMLCSIHDSMSDGVILTDLALIEYAGKAFRDGFEISASTQLNVHDVYGARFVKNLGATTVVLARETPYEQIQRIAEQVDVKIESFLHGAMCVCQSGQCLFSSIVGGNSGNRGMCAQPCRKFYKCYDGEKKLNEGYLLSPKDMCGLQTAQKLSNLGVEIFKIEGRNRRAEYAGATSSVYKRLFENGFAARPRDLSILKRTFNRGDYLSDEYLSGRKNNVIYKYSQGHMGDKIGLLRGGKLIADQEISKGDCFKIFRNKIEVGAATALSAGKRVELSISGKVKDGDDVYVTTDTALLQSVKDAKRLVEARLSFDGFVGTKPVLIAESNGVACKVLGEDICQKATKNPLDAAEIRKQLSKSGNTQFTITNIDVQNDDIFLPKSVLNDLRRRALDALSCEIISTYECAMRRKIRRVTLADVDLRECDSSKLAVICKDVNQFAKAVSRSDCDLLIADVERLDCYSVAEFASIAKSKMFYLDVPPFADVDFVVSLLPPNVGVVANNVGAVQICMENGVPFVCGVGLNVYNAHIAKLLMYCGADAFFYSQELTLTECRKIPFENGFKFVSGELKLMHLVHCPNMLNTSQTCANCAFRGMEYVDELGNRFKLRRRKAPTCTFELINGLPLSYGNLSLGALNCAVDFDENAVFAVKNNTKNSFVEKYSKGRLAEKVN